MPEEGSQVQGGYRVPDRARRVVPGSLDAKGGAQPTHSSPHWGLPGPASLVGLRAVVGG